MWLESEKMTEAMKSATKEVGYPNLKPNQLGALNYNVIKGDIILHEAIYSGLLPYMPILTCKAKSESWLAAGMLLAS